MKVIKNIFKSIKQIDTLTTKLLMLVLFIAIIPLIVSIDFSINTINQNIKENLRNELNLYKHLYKQASNSQFQKLEFITNNFSTPKASKDNIINPDFLVVVDLNHSVKFKNNKYGLKNLSKSLNDLIDYSLSGKTVKSFEILKNNSNDEIYQIVANPVFTHGKKVSYVIIAGKKVKDNYLISKNNDNLNKYQLRLLKIPVKQNNFDKIETYEKSSDQKEFIKNFQGKVIAIAYFKIEKSPFIKSVQKNSQVIRLVSVISLVVSIMLAALFSRSITTPILNLVKAAQIIAAGNLNHRVLGHKGNDEIAKLANSFNKMAESLQSQNQLKDNFVATLTHDLKVPMLAENQTITYMLKEIYGPITPEQREILELIKSTNNYSLKMVTTLLDVYRYETDHVKLIKSEFDIIKLINDSIYEIKSLALEKNISINTHFDKEEILIKADNSKIKRVIHNLIGNAITNGNHDGNIMCEVDIVDFKCIYHPEKSSEVSTSLTAPIDISNSIVITIEDNGIGISKQDISELFKRFALGKGRKPSGTGLGLYYSNQVITKHSGHIWAESIENKGSKFKFTLPL